MCFIILGGVQPYFNALFVGIIIKRTYDNEA